MDWTILLKALPIFSIVSNIAASWDVSRPLAAQEVILLVNQELDRLIAKRHLPADFKNDIGNLIGDVVAMHPDVPNPPKP